MEETVQNGQTATSPTSSDVQPPAPQGRQFPPPGTLVVVQGVVHTTDVSQLHEFRPSRPTAPRPLSVPGPLDVPRRASSTPRSHYMGETANGSRNRLSAFIPRPTSMFSGTTSNVEVNNTPPSSALNAENESDSEPASNVISDNSGSGDSTPASNEFETDARPPPALSPSSIDVLGTLLRYVLYLHLF